MSYQHQTDFGWSYPPGCNSVPDDDREEEDDLEEEEFSRDGPDDAI